jgi:hypothetical protein
VAAAAATTASSWGPMRGKAPEHLWRGALGPVICKGMMDLFHSVEGTPCLFPGP